MRADKPRGSPGSSARRRALAGTARRVWIFCGGFSPLGRLFLCRRKKPCLAATFERARSLYQGRACAFRSGEDRDPPEELWCVPRGTRTAAAAGGVVGFSPGPPSPRGLCREDCSAGEARNGASASPGGCPRFRRGATLAPPAGCRGHGRGTGGRSRGWRLPRSGHVAKRWSTGRGRNGRPAGRIGARTVGRAGRRLVGPGVLGDDLGR